MMPNAQPSKQMGRFIEMNESDRNERGNYLYYSGKIAARFAAVISRYLCIVPTKLPGSVSTNCAPVTRWRNRSSDVITLVHTTITSSQIPEGVLFCSQVTRELALSRIHGEKDTFAHVSPNVPTALRTVHTFPKGERSSLTLRGPQYRRVS